MKWASGQGKTIVYECQALGFKTKLSARHHEAKQTWRKSPMLSAEMVFRDPFFSMEPTNKIVFLSPDRWDGLCKKTSSFSKMTSQHSAALSSHFLPIIRGAEPLASWTQTHLVQQGGCGIQELQRHWHLYA